MSRLSGHELRAEGAAFYMAHHSRFPQRVLPNSTGGEGFAICSCGKRSPVLFSGEARKGWHRAHKDAMRTSPPAADAKRSARIPW